MGKPSRQSWIETLVSKILRLAIYCASADTEQFSPRQPLTRQSPKPTKSRPGPEHKTSALIIMLKGAKRASQVVFQNVEPDTSRTFVKELDELALMYPFRVFKKKGMGVSFRHLKHSVQYVFLVAGEVDKVFQDDQAHSLILLSAAVDFIYDT
jgi:hypothetical protein